MAHVIQISDTHLSPLAPTANQQWEHVVAYIHQHQPDLVVHTGDISLNGAGDETELDFALERLNQLSIPWLAVPGNHDVGDVGHRQQPINADRQEAFRQRFGTGFWVRVLDGWSLIGLDIQTLSAGDPASETHWEWFEAELQSTSNPISVFLHRPLTPDPTTPGAGALDQTEQWYVLQPARNRLQKLITEAGVRVVASGHLHQPFIWDEGDLRHVWASSTWAYLHDDMQPKAAEGAVTLVHHQFERDGAHSCRQVAPDTLEQLIFDHDFESPYNSLFT